MSRSRITHRFAAGDPGERPRQFNIVIEFDEAANQYAVVPGNTVIPPGFGTGTNGGRIRWFLMPKQGDTLTFNSNGPGGGIDFANPPSFLDLTYRNGNTIASTPWVNALTSNDAAQFFDYDVYVLVNGTAVTIDPDVENPPPPPGTF